MSRSSILPSNPFGGHTQQSSISSPSRSHLPQLAPRPTSTILAQNAYGKVIPASPASELNLSASGVSYALRARLDSTSSSHSLIPNIVHPDHTQTHRKSQTFPARSSEGLESCFSFRKVKVGRVRSTAGGAWFSRFRSNLGGRQFGRLTGTGILVKTDSRSVDFSLIES